MFSVAEKLPDFLPRAGDLVMDDYDKQFGIVVESKAQKTIGGEVRWIVTVLWFDSNDVWLEEALSMSMACAKHTGSTFLIMQRSPL